MEVSKIDKLFEQKISGHSRRMTSGDPQSYSNRASDATVNNIYEPQIPKKSPKK